MQHNFDLSKLAFLKVGGPCDVFFIPQNSNDLLDFLNHHNEITVLGNMSNVLISDLGIRGAVIKLDSINGIEFHDGNVKVGAGLLLSKLILECAKRNLSCCEKLFYIPGTIGGAIFMNAGIPGFEIADVLVSIDVIDIKNKTLKTIQKNKLNMSYRNGNISDNTIIISATLQTCPKNQADILSEIKETKSKRMKSQPIGQPTCGSTFKNPPNGLKAWQLIQQSKCDKLYVGGAKVSNIHSNFLINSGNATASDFWELIELIKSKVLEKTGILLEEEIIKIGEGFPC